MVAPDVHRAVLVAIRKSWTFCSKFARHANVQGAIFLFEIVSLLNGHTKGVSDLQG
jgi:hypothetical protein